MHSRTSEQINMAGAVNKYRWEWGQKGKGSGKRDFVGPCRLL